MQHAVKKPFLQQHNVQNLLLSCTTCLKRISSSYNANELEIDTSG